MRTYTVDKEDHPFIKGMELCRACLRAIIIGDKITLIPLGPGDNEEERARMKAGITYTAKHAIVHSACAHQNKEDF